MKENTNGHRAWKRRGLSILLTIAMLASLMTTTAFAEGEVTEETDEASVNVEITVDDAEETEANEEATEETEEDDAETVEESATEDQEIPEETDQEESAQAEDLEDSGIAVQSDEECEHDWGEWTIDQEPTCTYGHASRQCTICYDIERKTIDPIQDHAWSEWAVLDSYADQPDCTDKMISRFCDICGEGWETKWTPATAAHTWGEWEIVIEPTCSSGLKTRT